MLGTNLLDGFELIEIKSARNTNSLIRISADKRRFTIPTRFMKELGWEDKTRVNLAVMGKTFALVPDKVGLITIHCISGSAGQITSTNFNIEILSRTKSCKEYEGWVEDNVLFFRPKRGDE